MRDLLVLGGGAAGLAAAAYALDKQLDVQIIAEHVGGKAGWQPNPSRQTAAVPAAGEAVTSLLRERLAQQPAIVLNDSVTSITKTNGVFRVETRHHNCAEALALIVATGVTPVPLEVTGGKELLGYGLGYSAITHAQALSGSVVAAVGATVRAMRGVNELARIAKRVYWIGPTVQTLVSPLGMGLQYCHNVRVYEGYRILEVLGAERVDSIIIERAGDLQRLEVDSVFVDLGLKPNSALVKDLIGLDAHGFIPVNDAGATSQPGLFAAGDVTTLFGEQLLVAVGQGARAAMSAYDYVLSHRAERYA